MIQAARPNTTGPLSDQNVVLKSPSNAGWMIANAFAKKSVSVTTYPQMFADVCDL